MSKTFNASYLLIGAVFLACALSFAAVAHANPFFTASKAQSAAATSTVSYLTAGTGTTTTPVYDSYEVNGTNEKNQGNVTIPNSVAVLLQGNASSTLTVLNLQCEFSDDNIDWYQNEIFPASTTNPQNIGTPASFTFTFASSTIGGISISGSRFQKLVQCPIPLRYVRAVVTNTGSSTSLWAAIVPTKQRN